VDTRFDKEKQAFCILLPRGTFPAPTDMVSSFMAGLPETLKNEQPAASLAAATVPDAEEPSPSVLAPEAHAAPPASNAHSTSPAALPVAKRGGYTYMPDVKAMAKPDELLLKPPYYLVVYANNRESVEVECSHSPTLQMLAEYLKKWVKTNQGDRKKVCPQSMELDSMALKADTAAESGGDCAALPSSLWAGIDV
jgi:hypothetical protein